MYVADIGCCAVNAIGRVTGSAKSTARSDFFMRVSC
jgi:hypothetical protein